MNDYENRNLDDMPERIREAGLKGNFEEVLNAAFELLPVDEAAVFAGNIMDKIAKGEANVPLSERGSIAIQYEWLMFRHLILDTMFNGYRLAAIAQGQMDGDENEVEEQTAFVKRKIDTMAKQMDLATHYVHQYDKVMQSIFGAVAVLHDALARAESEQDPGIIEDRVRRLLVILCRSSGHDTPEQFEEAFKTAYGRDMATMVHNSESWYESNGEGTRNAH